MDVSFERVNNGKDEWLTPPEIINSLGKFDLDPCSPINRPWDTANHHYHLPLKLFEPCGLEKKWFGRVWLNPPYGNQTGKWLKKMAEHNNGIALIFARTETKMFFDYIWNRAIAIMFLKGRLSFYNIDGAKSTNSAGAPSCLVAYGGLNYYYLQHSGLSGKLIRLYD